MKISYLNMAPMHHELDGDMKQKFADVYFNNWFIMGKELEAFEEEYAAYCGTKYAVRLRQRSGRSVPYPRGDGHRKGR